MPTETLPTSGYVTSETVRSREEDDLRKKLALRHLADVRKFKVYLSVYLLSLLVLTPVWVVTQYYTQDGWPKHLSTRSRYAGDWDPWILWVALVGAIVVAIVGYRTYVRGADTDAEIRRETERIERNAPTGYPRRTEATGTHGPGWVGHLPPE